VQIAGQDIDQAEFEQAERGRAGGFPHPAFERSRRDLHRSAETDQLFEPLGSSLNLSIALRVRQ